MLIQFIVNKNKTTKVGNKLIGSICDDLIKKINDKSLNKQEINKSIKINSTEFRKIIYDNRKDEFYERAQKTVKLAMIAATTILVLGGILIQAFPALVISMFNSDPKLLEIGVPGLRIYLFMMPIIGISIIGSNYFQSIGKAKLATFLSLLRQVILLIPLTLVLPKIAGLGLTGVWLAGTVSDFLSTIITGLFIIKEFKKEDSIEDEKAI